MIPGLERVLARRAWFVPDLVVWGTPSMGEQDFLITDTVDGVKTVYYGSAPLGQSEQEVLYCELTDHRGNQLPDELASPRVFIRPKSATSAFVVGMETSERFVVARDPDADGPVTVDLTVVEYGD
jgi:hypothetical protein